MKVLVINEPFVPGFNRAQRWAARTRGRVLRAPDWLAYATAVLEREGCEVELHDFPAMGWDKARLRLLVQRAQPDFVVLDSTTPSIHSDIDCARICKQVSRAVTIMVGPHASALPEETLMLAGGAVDVICIGEYDLTVRDVIRAYPALRAVPGVCFRQGGAARRSAARELIGDLDSLPFPAWHQLDLRRYFDGTKRHPHVDIFASRGCPHGCQFCLWPQVMHGHRLRLRDPRCVVDEMARDIALLPELQRGGEFFFEDDSFTLVRSHAMAVCEEILRRRLKVTFSVNARADSADRELFRLLKRAGCRQLLVGFESGVDRLLQGVGKRCASAAGRTLVHLAGEAGLAVHGCFVFGLPGETAETITETLRYALSLDLATAQFAAAVPFPGTAFYARCAAQGLLRDRPWEAWLDGGEQAAVVEPPGLGPGGLTAAVDRALQAFYFRPRYLARFLRATEDLADLKRKIRGAVHFLSYLRERRRVHGTG
jgi:radical SAM superfamily enzyme YgiQ (UPF0313 family)